MFPSTTVKFCKSEGSAEAPSGAVQLEVGQFGVVPPIVAARSQEVVLLSEAELL